jgi:putative transcriptional regulator
MTKKYKSGAMASIHEMAEDLYEGGIIDKKTMRDFDDSCLTTVLPITAKKIRSIRERELVSQSVFAYYLNVSKGLISQWERGEKNPSGASLKLLSLVEKNGLATIA